MGLWEKYDFKFHERRIRNIPQQRQEQKQSTVFRFQPVDIFQAKQLNVGIYQHITKEITPPINAPFMEKMGRKGRGTF